MNNTTLQHLMDITIAFRDKRNWKPWHTPKNVGISLALEAAEVLDHVKWYNDDDLKKKFEKDTQAISEELMDVLFNLLVMCHELNIDIPKAYMKKLKKTGEKYPISSK